MKKYVIASTLAVTLLIGMSLSAKAEARTVHLLGRGAPVLTDPADAVGVPAESAKKSGEQLINSHVFVPLAPQLESETGTLLLSDSPEYVVPHGILYQDTVNGDSRVYFYHVNEAKESRKIAVIVKNNSDETADIMVKRTLATKPTKEYFEVGRELSRSDLEESSVAPKISRVRPGTTMLLFPELENIKVRKDELFSGIIDFSTNVPVTVSVMMIPLEYKAEGAVLTEPVLPYDDVHLRGTYWGMNRDIMVEPAYNPTIGAASLELANGREEAFLKGEDVTMNPIGTPLTKSVDMTVENTGNYGVAYTITVPTAGKGSYDLFFNPEGGAYAGSIKIDNKKQSKIYDIPGKERPYMGHKTAYDTQYLDTFESGTPLIIKFMPAGASNLPVRLLFVPHEKIQAQDLTTAKKKKS